MTGRRRFLGRLAATVAGIMCGRKLLDATRPVVFEGNVIEGDASGIYVPGKPHTVSAYGHQWINNDIIGAPSSFTVSGDGESELWVTP